MIQGILSLVGKVGIEGEWKERARLGDEQMARIEGLKARRVALAAGPHPRSPR